MAVIGIGTSLVRVPDSLIIRSADALSKRRQPLQNHATGGNETLGCLRGVGSRSRASDHRGWSNGRKGTVAVLACPQPDTYPPSPNTWWWEGRGALAAIDRIIDRNVPADRKIGCHPSGSGSDSASRAVSPMSWPPRQLVHRRSRLRGTSHNEPDNFPRADRCRHPTFTMIRSRAARSA